MINTLLYYSATDRWGRGIVGVESADPFSENAQRAANIVAMKAQSRLEMDQIAYLQQLSIVPLAH